jgi:hypothetical protein
MSIGRWIQKVLCKTEDVLRLHRVVRRSAKNNCKVCIDCFYEFNGCAVELTTASCDCYVCNGNLYMCNKRDKSI